jgi:hypothetical protein
MFKKKMKIKKIIIISLILLILSPFLFSQEIKNFTGDFYLTLSGDNQLSWCIGFLQGISEVVYLLQREYGDSTYLDFWSGGYMPIDEFRSNLEYFLKNSENARKTPLPYVGLIVVQTYYENKWGKR